MRQNIPSYGILTKVKFYIKSERCRIMLWSIICLKNAQKLLNQCAVRQTYFYHRASPHEETGRVGSGRSNEFAFATYTHHFKLEKFDNERQNKFLPFWSCEQTKRSFWGTENLRLIQENVQIKKSSHRTLLVLKMP